MNPKHRYIICHTMHISYLLACDEDQFTCKQTDCDTCGGGTGVGNDCECYNWINGELIKSCCHRSQCIPASQSCDGKKDCDDGSDEGDHCKIDQGNWHKFIINKSHGSNDFSCIFTKLINYYPIRYKMS